MRVGDELTPFVIESVGAEPMKTMALLLDDPSPIHYDAELVRELGLGDAPINQGPMNLGYPVELACRAGGGLHRLRRIEVRFLGTVFAGEQMECTARVSAIDASSGLIELELAATSDARPVLSGTATVIHLINQSTV